LVGDCTDAIAAARFVRAADLEYAGLTPLWIVSLASFSYHEPERLALEVEPGVTMADELNSVAVHNAYHLGKIVALRQRIGAWPPTTAAEGS
jgi:hypothetical protein